jgi:hypothetical protein
MHLEALEDQERKFHTPTAWQVPLVGKYTVRWARWDGAETSVPPLLQEEHASYAEVRRWSVRVIAGCYTVAATAVTLSATHVQVSLYRGRRLWDFSRLSLLRIVTPWS